MKHKTLFFTLLFLLFCLTISAQSRRFTISGNITDSTTGENLIGATVFVEELQIGTAANVYGFYSLSIPEGTYRLTVTFVGYEQHSQTVELTQNTRLNIRLSPQTSALDEVVVSAVRRDANVSQIGMSVQQLSIETLRRIPALMGEVDVIKAIQLLPGVQQAAAGSTGFSVRGGGHDQNLILLDEAVVYNASHLMGFFSVFNNDAIKDVRLYKGDIPANFGGRLSSVLDIRTRDGNNQRFAATGGIGTISSRLTVEGPILTDRMSYLVSGRRTYADIFLRLANDEGLRNSVLYFYDLNAKVNYRIDDNNRVFLAAYLGRDRFETSFAGMEFGNRTFTARWNRIFTPRLFSNFTFIGSMYDYYLRAEISEQLGMDWRSQLNDYGIRADFSFHPNPNNHIRFGYHLTYHDFLLGEGGGIGEQSIIARFSQPNQLALNHSWYASNESSLGERFSIRYGLRYTLFQNISNGEPFDYLENYAVRETATYRRGTIFHNVGRFEPRLGMIYQMSNLHSVKASYTRTAQFIHLASNSTAGSPLDVWFQTSPNVKPQMSDQFAIGYFRNFRDNMFETSIELYYRNMQNVIDFRDHAVLMGNNNLEQELRFGTGRAYGVEFMVRKNEGRLNGWVSYTLSRAVRTVDEINYGQQFRSPFDRPHNISVVLNYELSRRWIISANWVYLSGMPVTFPVGRYEIAGRYVPIYSARNEYRFPAYHRLDLSATYSFRRNDTRRWQSELNFSLFNAYGRKNPWTIMFRQDRENPHVTYAEMMYLFSFVPSITYNFRW